MSYNHVSKTETVPLKYQVRRATAVGAAVLAFVGAPKAAEVVVPVAQDVIEHIESRREAIEIPTAEKPHRVSPVPQI